MSNSYTISASPDVAPNGHGITVSWTVPGASKSDYIRMYEMNSGVPTGVLISNVPATGVYSGSMVMANAPTGVLEFRYYLASARAEVATSNQVTVLPAVTATATYTSSQPGNRLNLAWSVNASTSTDVVGLYLVGASDDEAEWQETNSHASASVAVDLLMPVTAGQHEMRYLWKAVTPYQVLKGTPFTVSGDSIITLTPSATSANTGDTLTVTWHSSYYFSTDKIGLFSTDASIYDSPISAQSTGNHSSGTLTFTAPEQAGTYEFRYLGVGTTAAARSASITVTPPAPVSTTLTATPDTVDYTDVITVDWATPVGSTADKIEYYVMSNPLYPQGLLVWWENASGATSGTWSPQGNYSGQVEFRYHSAASNTDLAVSNRVTVNFPTTQATVSASPTQATPGQQVTASWTATAPSQPDTIGLFLTGAAEGSAPISSQATNGATQGNPSFNMPMATGTYEFRYLSQGQVTVARSSAITVAEAEVTLSVSATTAAPDTRIWVTWSATNPGQNDWIGFFRVGADDNNPLSTYPVNGNTSISTTWLMPSQPGHFEFRYYGYSSSTPVARSEVITVEAPQITMSATPGSVPSGEPIMLVWTAVNGSATDTISLIAVDSGSSIALQETGTTGSGTLTFTAPDQFTSPTGQQFVFRYFFVTASESAAESNAVNVTLPQVTVSIITPMPIAAGGSINVSWEASNSTASDEIGLYSVNAADSSPVAYHSTGGARSGQLSFTAPTSDGEYHFRYLLNGETSIGHSDYFDIGRGSASAGIADSLPDVVPFAALQQIIVNQATADADFRALLISDPVTALTQLFGSAPPEGLSFTVTPEPLDTFYFVVPNTAGAVTYDAGDSNVVIQLRDHRAPLPLSETGVGDEVEEEGEEEEEPQPWQDPDVGVVTIPLVAPPALLSRSSFQSQVDYQLYNDSNFYNEFISNPASVWAKLNYDFPSELNFALLQNSATQINLVLPYPPHDALFTPPYALEFKDGLTDYVIIRPPQALTFPNGITVEAWIKAAAFHTATDDVIASMYQTTPAGGWELRVGGGIPRFVVNIAGQDYTAEPTTPPIVLATDEWYYLAGTYDGQQVLLYLNGQELQTSVSAAGQITNGSQALTFGRRGDQSDSQNFFQGLLFDIRIWNEALGEERIRSKWLAGRSQTPVPQDGLQAWYPMTEGTGTTLYDHSGNDNQGALEGTMWVSTYPDTPR